MPLTLFPTFEILLRPSEKMKMDTPSVLPFSPLVISTAILILIVLTIAVSILAFTLIVRREDPKSPRRRRRGAVESAARKHKGPKRFNPLRGVTFRDLLDHNAISEKISANAAEWIEQSLGEGGMRAVQAAALKAGADHLGNTPANQALKVLAGGKPAQLPSKLQEALSAKKLFETSLTVVPGVITAASPVVPVVVGCFGLLQGLEKATPWRNLDEKLRESLELRSLDRLSHLQAVFEELKGELSTAEPDETHLKSLRLKLKEIRLVAQNEIRLKFSYMKPPLPKAFLWWSWGLGAKQAAMRDQILMELCRLREVQVAIHLEQLIWMVLGQSPIFIDEISPEIVADLKQIGELTSERISWVKGTHAKELAQLKSLPLLMAEVLEFESEDFDLRPQRKAAA